MSEEISDWMEALFRPSRVFSIGALVVGSWLLLLTTVNIAIGAYSEDRKVMWIDFLTNGPSTNVPWEFGIVVDDIIFGIVGFALLAAGYLMLEKSTDGGAIEWIKGLGNGPLFSSLISSDDGFTRTVASWSVVIGFSFYISWSSLNNTWVDPGVYSVMIAFVSVGFALHALQDSESTH